MEMTTEELKKFKKIVSIISHRLGFTNEIEEITSEILLKRQQGIGKKQRLEHAIIDAIRGIGWGTRNTTDKRKFDPIEEFEEILPENGHARKYRDLLFDFNILINKSKSLSKDERASVILYHIHGFNMREIAYLFNLTEAAVSIKLAGAEEKLKELT